MTVVLAALLALTAPPVRGFSDCADRTGAGAVLLIPSRPDLTRGGSPIAPGDELAVLTPSGACVGTVRWEGASVGVTVWADDPVTPEVDGLRNGDPIRLAVHVPSTGETYASSEIDVTFEEALGVSGGFARGGVYAVAAAPAATPSTGPSPAPPPAPPVPDSPDEPAGPPEAPQQGSRPAVLAINEVDVDPGRSGESGFVELRAEEAGAVLAGFALAFVDGNGRTYATVDLAGQETSESGLFVVRPKGSRGLPGDLTSPSLPEIRGGVGAVALYRADVPVGARATTDNLVDAVVFGPPGAGRADDLLAQLGQRVQYVESGHTSLQRLDIADHPATTGGDVFASSLLHPVPASPGSGNVRRVTVDRTREVQDAAGLRLVSVPVLDESGRPKAVGDLAGLNLVRGVSGGTRPAQYPAAAPNVMTAYDNASGLFVAPATTDEPLAPGAGFFWHWFDEDAPPSSADGGGTSRSYDLASEAFALAAAGVPVDDALGDGPYVRTVGTQTSDGVYLIGNPYPYPLRLNGVWVEEGTLHTTFAVWDPVRSTYENLYAGSRESDALPVWAGAVAEVTRTGGPLIDGPFEIFTTSHAVDPTAGVAVEGAARRRTEKAAGLVEFELTGTLASGTAVTDVAAHVRFVGGASAGWDRYDGSKLAAPVESFALIAPVGARVGVPHRHRVLSLPPLLLSARTVPLAFTSSEGGAFALRWNAEGLRADWSATLHDRTTGTTVDLRERGSYSFRTSGAAPWAERFEVVVAPASTPTEGGVAQETTVGDPYPNPAAGRVRLDVRAATGQRVTADVYDALGRRVMRAFEAAVPAGRPSTIDVDTGGLAPGLYVVRVEGETFAETRRVVVAR